MKGFLYDSTDDDNSNYAIPNFNISSQQELLPMEENNGITSPHKSEESSSGLTDSNNSLEIRKALTLSQYTPLILPSFSSDQATKFITEALASYTAKQFLVKFESTSEFNITSFAIFNKDLSNQLPLIKSDSFAVLVSLNTDMENSLGSCIHAAIYESIIRLQLLWPTTLASKLCIALPISRTPRLNGTRNRTRIRPRPR